MTFDKIMTLFNLLCRTNWIQKYLNQTKNDLASAKTKKRIKCLKLHCDQILSFLYTCGERKSSRKKSQCHNIAKTYVDDEKLLA